MNQPRTSNLPPVGMRAGAVPPAAFAPATTTPKRPQPTAGPRFRVRFVIAALLASCAAVLYWFPPEESAFYPRCLWYSMTGWQCPGCGGLRATHQLLHGHVAAAFALNPFLFLLGPLLLVYGLGRIWKRWTGRDWLRPFRRPFWLWFLLGLSVLFSIARNLSPEVWRLF